MKALISPETSKNFRLPKFENRDCVTVDFPYGYPTVRTALREPKNGYATRIFQNYCLPFIVFSVPPKEPHGETACWGFLISFGDRFSVYALACAIELSVGCNGQTTFIFVYLQIFSEIDNSYLNLGKFAFHLPKF